MNAVTLESRLARNEDLVSGRIDDEFIMMSIETGKYYQLNLTASRIWELLDTPQTAGELCDSLRSGFKVSPEVCQKEVLDFVSRLVAREIVQVV